MSRPIRDHDRGLSAPDHRRDTNGPALAGIFFAPAMVEIDRRTQIYSPKKLDVYCRVAQAPRVAQTPRERDRDQQTFKRAPLNAMSMTEGPDPGAADPRSDAPEAIAVVIPLYNVRREVHLPKAAS